MEVHTPPDKKICEEEIEKGCKTYSRRKSLSMKSTTRTRRCLNFDSGYNYESEIEIKGNKDGGFDGCHGTNSTTWKLQYLVNSTLQIPKKKRSKRCKYLCPNSKFHSDVHVSEILHPIKRSWKTKEKTALEKEVTRSSSHQTSLCPIKAADCFPNPRQVVLFFAKQYDNRQHVWRWGLCKMLNGATTSVTERILLKVPRRKRTKRGRPLKASENSHAGVPLNNFTPNMITDAKKMEDLTINQPENHEHGNALVLYDGDDKRVQHENMLPGSKRKCPPPKVDLDSESNRVWMLLMGKENVECPEGSNDETDMWWERERNVWKGRVDSFIARMHLIQGYRRFSRWKGSVVDSMGGVFLTQNVSDLFSSNAFMSLASEFPSHPNQEGNEFDSFCTSPTTENQLNPADTLIKQKDSVFEKQDEEAILQRKHQGINNIDAEIKGMEFQGKVCALMRKSHKISFQNSINGIQGPESGELNSQNVSSLDCDVEKTHQILTSEEISPKHLPFYHSEIADPFPNNCDSNSHAASSDGTHLFQNENRSVDFLYKMNLESMEEIPEESNQMEHVFPSDQCKFFRNSDAVQLLDPNVSQDSILRKVSASSDEPNDIHPEITNERTKRKNVSKHPIKEIDWEYLRKKVCCNDAEKKRGKDTLDAVDWEAVRSADVSEISNLIRGRGMNNMLAERIKDFLNGLVKEHGAIDLEWLRDIPPDNAKDYLLRVRGLGLKSAECIQLLTLHQPAFPVDTNVGRICVRLGWVPLQPLPESLQLHLLEQYPVIDSIHKYLWPRLCKLDHRILYELHYQMITFGKVFCTKTKPNCNACPMKADCRHFASAFASERFALPGLGERSLENTSLYIPPYGQDLKPTFDLVDLPLLEGSSTSKAPVNNCEPIIEEPTTPEHEIENVEVLNNVAEIENPYEIPKIELNITKFAENVHIVVQENKLKFQEGFISNALVSLSPEAASIPQPKLKNISRLRTEHQAYELPDSHPLLEGMDPRDPNDPSPYLLAIWTPGEIAQSMETPKTCCGSQEIGTLCENIACFGCNCIREARAQKVRGTLLIPCRTAMRGSFPLNGTFFQINEVFADHCSSLSPIDVPREWIWNLPRRTVYFGTSISTIFKGLTTESIQHCFWKGFVCIRGFDQKLRSPRSLMARLHFPASKTPANLKKTTSKQHELD